MSEKHYKVSSALKSRAYNRKSNERIQKIVKNTGPATEGLRTSCCKLAHTPFTLIDFGKSTKLSTCVLEKSTIIHSLSQFRLIYSTHCT